VHRLDSITGNITAFDVIDKSLDSAATAFADGPDGSVWIGTYVGGLLRYKNGKMTRLTTADGVPTGFVRDLFFDSMNRLWICTSIGGVGRIDNTVVEKPTVATMTVRDGLSSDQVTAAVEDRFGRIFFGTGRGIDVFVPETGRFQHYTTADGLADNFVNVATAMKDGTLWFGTLNGLSSFSPVANKPSKPPRTLISNVLVNGQRRPIGELGRTEVQLADLAPSENQLEIEFVSLNFAAGERLLYQYRFGSESEWSLPTQERKVTLPNLSSGRFSFEVRAINTAGEVSERPALVAFRVLPPVFLRWWFLMIAALLFFMVAYGSYTYRTARLREVNAALEEARAAEESLRISREDRIAELENVRSRIATDLHDDIGASLTQIAVLSEVAQTRSRGGAPDVEQLSKITEVSNELVGTMSDIVWSINPAKDQLSDLTQRMRRFAADVLAARDIRLHFAADAGLADRVISSNLRREIYLIFKESINNVVKHAKASNVHVNLNLRGGTLFLEVRDDGGGFDPAEASHAGNGNGLASMRRRASDMGGKIDVSSTPGVVTVVTAEFPIGSSDRGKV
ncbi:MAG: ATP-binding protein, partial [Pyrinomonadaceae bacterium]|nr:ATP-binding protein [Pyrinomonadaceae bacterium]